MAFVASAKLQLPVGDHCVVLAIVDSGGTDSSEKCSIPVLPFGLPTIFHVLSSNGTRNENQVISITGSGFNFTAAQTIVTFGPVNLTGVMIQLVNTNTISVMSQSGVIASSVLVSVTTPIGTGDKVTL